MPTVEGVPGRSGEAKPPGFWLQSRNGRSEFVARGSLSPWKRTLEGGCQDVLYRTLWIAGSWSTAEGEGEGMAFEGGFALAGRESPRVSTQ